MGARTRRALLAGATVALALAAAGPASATTTGIDVDTSLVDQQGTVRIVGSGGLIGFDVTCDMTASKWFETRLLAAGSGPTAIGSLTSAAIGSCSRPVRSATVLGVADTLGGSGTYLGVFYEATDLATGAMIYSIPGFGVELDVDGLLCLYAGMLSGVLRATGRDLRLSAALPGPGGLCPLRINIDALLGDDPAIQFTLLHGRGDG